MISTAIFLDSLPISLYFGGTLLNVVLSIILALLRRVAVSS